MCRSSRSKDGGAERHPRGERAVQLRRLRDHRRRAPRRAGSRERAERDRKRRLRGDRAGPARLSRGPTDAPQEPRGPRARARRWLHPDSVQRAGALDRRPRRHGRHTRSLRRRRWHRGKAGARRRRLGGADSLSRPRRGRPLDRPRRGRVGALRRRCCTGLRPCPHTWLRAHVPPPHCDVRRGAVGDRAGARAHRRRSIARHRTSQARRRRSDNRSARLGRVGSTTSTSKTCTTRCWRA